MQYIDEDLENKYVENKYGTIVTSVIIPMVISIFTVYMTNNNIINLYELLEYAILFIFIVGLAYLEVFSINKLRYVWVNTRRNLLEFKDVLRELILDMSK